MGTVNRFLINEAGQDLIEYSLLIVFVLIASTIIFQQTGSSVTTIWANGSTVVQCAAGSHAH